MSVRNKALKWYEVKYGKTNGPLYTSKLYQPNEFWTKTIVWYIEIPKNIIQDSPESSIHLLCQKESDEIDFYPLLIPAMFFLQNLNNLEVNKERFSLFLSAELDS